METCIFCCWFRLQVWSMIKRYKSWWLPAWWNIRMLNITTFSQHFFHGWNQLVSCCDTTTRLSRQLKSNNTKQYHVHGPAEYCGGLCSPVFQYSYWLLNFGFGLPHVEFQCFPCIKPCCPDFSFIPSSSTWLKPLRNLKSISWSSQGISPTLLNGLLYLWISVLSYHGDTPLHLDTSYWNSVVAALW